MKILKRLLSKLDGWQRRRAAAAVPYAVVRKFGDDDANLYVVSLGWYGFTAIYPLLLVVVTVFGFVGVASLGRGIVSTLHEFPVIGSQFNPGHGSDELHGSVFGLVFGLLMLIYGAQGVTQVAQQTMTKVWNISQLEVPNFASRLGRSILGLMMIGGAFFVSAFLGSIAVSKGQALEIRILLIAALAIINVCFYLGSFVVLTPKAAGSLLRFVPGAILGGVGFTLLTTVGTGLVQHQLRNTTATYGAFASVIGVVTYLLLVSKLSIYAAELNPVIARRLWPRSLPNMPPTRADDEVLASLVREDRRRHDQKVGVEFGGPHERQARGA